MKPPTIPELVIAHIGVMGMFLLFMAATGASRFDDGTKLVTYGLLFAAWMACLIGLHRWARS